MAGQWGVGSGRGATTGVSARCVAVGVLVACLAGGAVRAAAQEAGPATAPATRPASGPVIADGPVYPVSRFDVRYARANTGLPESNVITGRPVEVGVIGGEFVVPPSLEKKWLQLQLPPAEKLPDPYHPRPIEQQRVTLDALAADAPKPYHTSAIWAINEQVKSFLNARGVIGVYVAPDPAEIDLLGRDLRGEGKTTLTLLVYTGVVRQVRTVASGDRVRQEDRIDSGIHARIRENSPVVRAEPGAEPGGQNLLRRDLLDPYVFSLNRHPGRRVDVAVSAFSTEEPGAVILDYLVTEAKPWAVYAQVSNTGTQDTNEWRERFGFVHNQLTNNDDILSIDYVTAGFQDSHAVQGSYEAPVGRSRTLRWRLFGTYSEFTASDVGQAAENFEGQQYDAGGELIWNVYQRRDFFVDVFGGLKYERVRVDNRDIDVTGAAGFIVPYAGVRAQRLADTASTLAELTLLGRFTDASQEQLDALGRFDADDTAMVLQFQLSQSIFLEPLLFPAQFKATQSTLAHEIVVSAHAQTSFGARLIPQAQDVIGGLYSVRGYDESVASGDSALLGSLEYRWHVPRSFKPREPDEKQTFLGMKAFKWVPQQAFGRPDWDLILRTFVDAGQTYNADRLSFEHDETLLSVGIGAELQVKQNVSLRVDWGFPLNDVEAPGVTTESSRVHVSATLLW